MSDRVEMQVPAEPEALSSMRALLRRWLRHAGASDQEAAEILTACGEAATNAIEHAGTGNGSRFVVSASRDGQDIEIEVRDSGKWRREREDDQGRGLDLMHTLMDSVTIDPGAEGTTVSLRRTLGQDGAAL
jgi:anti-sigma regulatory factor (Ser/Thr protein kinase)